MIQRLFLIFVFSVTPLVFAQNANPPQSLNEALAADFQCPTGTHDSGGGKTPGTLVRWCDLQRDGRPIYHGPLWRWYPSGKPEGREYYLNGDAAGVWPSYFENGNMSSLGNWVNGSKTGLWKYWREDGSLLTEVTYSRGGNSRTDYYRDGKKKATGTFLSSGKIGKWIYWDQEGKEKARCDFGDGVFTAVSSGCQLIAKELDPKGFSFPRPELTKNGERNISLTVGTERVNLTVPTGWSADFDAGRSEELPAVFYPSGTSWRSGAPNMYLRVLFSEGRTFRSLVQNDWEDYKSDVANFQEGKSGLGILRDGREYIVKSISYNPVIPTDSPFSIVGSNRQYERCTYLNISRRFVLLLVLTSKTEQELQQAANALVALRDSVH